MLDALVHLRMFDFCTPQFIENKHCTCSLMPHPQLRCQAALQLQRIMRGKLARKKVIYLFKCAEIRVGGRHIMATFLVSNVHPVGHLYDGWIFCCVLDGKRVHTIDHLKNVVAKQQCVVFCVDK